MSFLFKWFDKLAEDEDGELWKVFYNLYGPSLELSLLFPSWRRSRLSFTLTVLCFYAFIFPVHIWLLAEGIICVQDDFNLVSIEFHYWLILVFSLISIFLMNSNRKSMVNMHRTLTIGVGQYEAGRIYDEELPLQLEKDKRKQTIQFLFIPGLTLLLAGVLLLVPYLKKMDGKVHYNSRGANMKLPIAICYPFPTHEGVLYLLAILGQFAAAIGLASVIATLDLLLFRSTQSLIYEYKVLQYALKTIMARAKRMYGIRYPTNDIKKVNVKDVALQRCIGKCLRDSIVHHHDIQKLVREYMMLIKWPGFLAYGFGTGVIGLSLINMMEAKKIDDYESLVIFFGLALAEVLNMFIVSSFGEAITTEGKNLREQLYFIDWHKLDKSNRKTMLNFQVGITNPVRVRVGGVVDVTLDTFSSIINASYSFFNLVNAQ